MLLVYRIHEAMIQSGKCKDTPEENLESDFFWVVKTFCQDGLFPLFRMIITQEATSMNILAATDISLKIIALYLPGEFTIKKKQFM